MMMKKDTIGFTHGIVIPFLSLNKCSTFIDTHHLIFLIPRGWLYRYKKHVLQLVPAFCTFVTKTGVSSLLQLYEKNCEF